MSAAGVWLCLLRAFCIATFVHSLFGHSSVCSAPVILATFVPCSRPGCEAGEYGGKRLRVVILRGIGEVCIDGNGINMSKRRSWTVSWTVFFAFWSLWTHCLPLFEQYGCMYSPCRKRRWFFFGCGGFGSRDILILRRKFRSLRKENRMGNDR
jgi:hypothetical protein